MSLGIDTSNYQPIPMQADCEALKAYGIEFAIVGLQDPLHGESQAVVFRTFGITVEDCYIESLPFPRIPGGMKRGWVAVESGSGFVTEADVDAQLDWLRQHGLEAGLYGSMRMFEALGLLDLLGSKWANLPLWLAGYPTHGQPYAIPGAEMTQYAVAGQTTARIPGIDFDLDLDYREDAPEEETVDVTALDFDQTVAANEAVYAHFSNVAIDQHGGGMYEVSAAEAAKFQVNGGPIPLPTTGRIFVTVLPEGN